MSIRWRVLFCVAHVYLHHCTYIRLYIYVISCPKTCWPHSTPGCGRNRPNGNGLISETDGGAGALVADRHDQPQFAAILRCVQHVPWLNFTAEWKRVGRCSKRLKKQIQEQLVVSGLRYFGLLAITMANMMPGLDMFVLFVIALSISWNSLMCWVLRGMIWEIPSLYHGF